MKTVDGSVSAPAPSLEHFLSACRNLSVLWPLSIG